MSGAALVRWRSPYKGEFAMKLLRTIAVLATACTILLPGRGDAEPAGNRSRLQKQNRAGQQATRSAAQSRQQAQAKRKQQQQQQLKQAELRKSRAEEQKRRQSQLYWKQMATSGTAKSARQANALPAAGADSIRKKGKDAPKVATTATLNAAASQEPLLRDMLMEMSAADRGVVSDYIKALSYPERIDLRETMIPLPVQDRKARLLQLARTGTKPEGVEELRRRAGFASSPDLPPMTIAARNPSVQSFSASALISKGTALLPAQAAAPDFTAAKLGGGTVSLADLRGKPVVIEFGSITCPVYRGKIPAIAQLKNKYGERAEFLLVYTVEAHPQGTASPYSDKEWIPNRNVRDGVLRQQPDTAQSREALAREAVTKWGETLPVAVDSMDNAVWRSFGARANSAYVLDAEGRVVLSQEWTDGPALDAALAAIVQ